MQTIKYKIQFFSDWHCGSGLSAGADLDALVIKDSYKLPYLPGKTIKGLVREAVDDILQFTNKPSDILEQAMGSEGCTKGITFFTNATLEKEIAHQITESDASTFLYRTVAYTAIDDDGIAKDHSLRKMEVVVPCDLEGEIIDIPDEIEELISQGLQMIKRLGQNRNRGLGRCQITIINREGGKS